MQRVGQSFKIFFRPFAPGQLWAGFLPLRRNGMHLSGRFVKSNHWRLWCLRPRGAVLDSHACAMLTPFACAIICGVACASAAPLHMAVTRAVYLRACARPPCPLPLLPEKKGVKACSAYLGPECRQFSRGPCAALTVNSIGRSYFGKSGEKKSGLRRTAEDFSRRHEIFYIYFFHCVLYAWARIAEPVEACLTGQNVTSRVCRAVLPMTFVRCMQAIQEPPSPYAAFRAHVTSQLRRFQ